MFVYSKLTKIPLYIHTVHTGTYASKQHILITCRYRNWHMFVFICVSLVQSICGVEYTCIFLLMVVCPKLSLVVCHITSMGHGLSCFKCFCTALNVRKCGKYTWYATMVTIQHKLSILYKNRDEYFRLIDTLEDYPWSFISDEIWHTWCMYRGPTIHVQTTYTKLIR